MLHTVPGYCKVLDFKKGPTTSIGLSVYRVWQQESGSVPTVDSTVDSYMFTCPAITVATVILRALDRVRERALEETL